MAIVTWPGLPSDWSVELDLPLEWTPYGLVRGQFLKALDADNKHLRETDTPLDEEQFLKRYFWRPWAVAGHCWLWAGSGWIDLPSEEETPPPPPIEFAVRRRKEEFRPLFWSPLAPFPFIGPLAFDFSRLLNPVEGSPGYVLHVRLNHDLAQAFGTAAPNVDPSRAPTDPVTVAPTNPTIIDAKQRPKRQSVMDRRLELVKESERWCKEEGEASARNPDELHGRAVEDARARGDKDSLDVLLRAKSRSAVQRLWKRYQIQK